jgi:hypothetical protein
LGVAPKDLSDTLVHLNPRIERAPFVADLATGLVYLGNPVDTEAVRRAAGGVEGYAATFGGPAPRSTLEAWGYVPEGLELMRALKARWDPMSILDPGTLVLER